MQTGGAQLTQLELEQQGQLAITDDLPQSLFLLGDHGQPASHPFLDRENGHSYDFGGRRRIESSILSSAS